MTLNYNDLRVSEARETDDICVGTKLIISSLERIIQYLKSRKASYREAVKVFEHILASADIESGTEVLSCGGVYTETDYLSAFRAEELRSYLWAEPWMNPGDINSVCLALQEYVEEYDPGPTEYQLFLEWLDSRPVRGNSSCFWIPKFFENIPEHIPEILSSKMVSNEWDWDLCHDTEFRKRNIIFETEEER